MTQRLRSWLSKTGAGPIAALGGLLLLTTVALAALAGTRLNARTPYNRAAYDELMKSRVRSMDDLLAWFFRQQDVLSPVVPPRLDEFYQPGLPDVLVIDRASGKFPDGFVEALNKAVPTWRNSVATYDIEVRETYAGDIELRDLDGNLLYTDPAPPG